MTTHRIAMKSGGLSDPTKYNSGGVTAHEQCLQHGCARVRTELCLPPLTMPCSAFESLRVLEHRMHNLFLSCRLIQAVSFANDAPHFAERDPVQMLSPSFVTANAVAAGSTVDCKGASVSPSLAVSGRMSKLKRVFHENGIHVIGIQEGRASNDGRLTGTHCEIFTAAVKGTTKPLSLRTPRECSSPISAYVLVTISCVATLWFAMFRLIKAQWKRELPSMNYLVRCCVPNRAAGGRSW